MTMPPLPAAGDTNWRDDWAQAVHDAATEVTEGRLTEEAQRAAFGPVLPVSNVTRDGAQRPTGFDEGPWQYRDIAYDPVTGMVTSFKLNGVTHTVSYDANLLVTGVS